MSTPSTPGLSDSNSVKGSLQSPSRTHTTLPSDPFGGEDIGPPTSVPKVSVLEGSLGRNPSTSRSLLSVPSGSHSKTGSFTLGCRRDGTGTTFYVNPVGPVSCLSLGL